MRPFGGTQDGQREIQSSGGKASGAARRARRSMCEAWDVIRKLPLTDGEKADIDEIQSVAAVKGKNLTVEQAIIFAITRKAMGGDVKAFTALNKYTETQRAIELQNKKTQCEIDKLKLELNAYKKAVERADAGAVSILDNIPNETD